MCVVSMVMDHYYDKWTAPPTPTYNPPIIPWQPPIMPTQAELDEFRELLRRAREYDKLHGQPDCEIESKRQRIRDLADELGVEVNFV